MSRSHIKRYCHHQVSSEYQSLPSHSHAPLKLWPKSDSSPCAIVFYISFMRACIRGYSSALLSFREWPLQCISQRMDSDSMAVVCGCFLGFVIHVENSTASAAPRLPKESHALIMKSKHYCICLHAGAGWFIQFYFTIMVSNGYGNKIKWLLCNFPFCLLCLIL